MDESMDTPAGGDEPKPTSEDKKPEVPAETKTESDYIKLKVVAQDATEVQFRVKTTTSMRKLMQSFSEKMGTPMTSLRFLTDGRRITAEDTAGSLELEDGDTIEVFTNQVGGH